MSLKHQQYKEENIRFLENNLEEEGVMELPCEYNGDKNKINIRYYP